MQLWGTSPIPETWRAEVQSLPDLNHWSGQLINHQDMME